MKVWSVANQKGGVGKTTSVVALGGLFAEQKRRVLLMDLDPHGSLTSYFKHDPDTIENSAFNLFAYNGKVPTELPRQLIVPTGVEYLDLLPASTALATLERRMVGVEGMGLIISKTLNILWDDYDYVLIDNSPSLGVLMINALAACQKLIIPVQTEFLALKGLERMMHTLQMVIRSQSHELDYMIVPTMFDRRTQASTQTLRTLKKQYAEHIWRFAIPVDTKFRDASRMGIPPGNLDAATHGVRAYKRLLVDLLN
ncbi:ATPase involved in chromosome partitioning [Oleiphilus messinensis]|uniref:ATPase involved in chromosome partitioning n=1 Tax=Oleiphilus messinensis TaxID=141451 RepID=A0A1Y0IDJ3_9GAMM|nr:ParA family protein [Oleiphilus messinensis]ARU57555.1 ATPase involved in chromosome partitioning [Oleiphilus messinensis]